MKRPEGFNPPGLFYILLMNLVFLMAIMLIAN